MAERKYKCPVCGNTNFKTESVTHNKRQYCVGCYEQLEKNKKEREYLLKYIAALYGLNANQKMDGRILKDLKDLNEEGHTYSDIFTTLRYCSEIKKLTFDVKFALGCVRYYKNECMAYVKAVQERVNQSKDLQPLQVKVVHAVQPKTNSRLSKRIINIADL